MKILSQNGVHIRFLRNWLQQLRRDFLSQRDRAGQRAFCLGAPDIFGQVRHGAQINPSSGNARVRANGSLAPATHPRRKDRSAATHCDVS